MGSSQALTVNSGDLMTVTSFAAHEGVSTLFTVTVTALCDNPSIDLDFVAGKPATLAVKTGLAFAPLGGARLWAGICERAEQLRVDPSGTSTYRVRIVPFLWLLTQRRSYRIFQHTTIPDIVDQLLLEWNIKPVWSIHRPSFPPLEHRCQYGESDYAFMSRLLEEAGIAFTFPEDPATGSVLTFGDKLASASKRAAPPIRYAPDPGAIPSREILPMLRVDRSVAPGAYTLEDFDFRRPDFDLLAEAPKAAAPEDRYEQYQYQPGALLIESDAPRELPIGDAKGRARTDVAFGKERATRALAAKRSRRNVVAFTSNAIDLGPGTVFAIEGHPRSDLPDGQTLLVTELSVEGEAGQECCIVGQAVLTSIPYFPALTTPKPVIHSVQTALVVGQPGDEIHTDELGRARVQFPWDRRGKKDGNSSCWVRVSQGWAGSGFGFFALPRVGQEVLIDFINGDPDLPMIVGRIHNLLNLVPAKLPAGKTHSAWKSDSSPGSDGNNQIVFEDEKSNELVNIQAQKNLRHLIKHDETITVDNDRTKAVTGTETETTTKNRTQTTIKDRSELIRASKTSFVGKTSARVISGDEIEQTEGDHLRFVGKDQHLIVKQVKRERVDDDSHLKVEGRRNESFGGHALLVGGDLQEKVGGKHALATAEALHYKAMTDLVGDGVASVTLKGPGGFIRIGPAGIEIQGTLVKINAGGSAGSAPDAKPSNPEDPKKAQVKEPDVNPPEPDVAVAIKNEGGLKGGCRFIAKGKSHRYSALGSPGGGTFKWTATGKASIKGAANKDVVEVNGDSVSGALDDSELKVEYTRKGKTATDSIKLTVYEVTKIEAKLRATPCRRDGSRADAMPAMSSTSDSKVFDATAITVLRGCGDLKLTATVAPAGVPLAWSAERDAGDTGLSGEPTHVSDGDDTKRILHTDATGSFHVAVFVDCNGDGKMGAREGGIVLNVNMVQIEILPGLANNKIVSDSTQYRGVLGGGSLRVDSGSAAAVVPASGSLYGDGVFAGHAVAMKATVQLTGGDSNQRRGVDKIGMGYLQDMTGDNFMSTYADGRTEKEVFSVAGPPPSTVTTGLLPLLAFPVRDHRSGTGNGADTFINSSSDADKSTPGNGERRIVRFIDSPAVIVDATHPVTGSALTSISGTNDFAAFLVAFSKDFDENFVVYARGGWVAEFGTFTAGAWSNVKAQTRAGTAMNTSGMPMTGEASGMERCPPGATQNLVMDAR